MSEGESGTSVTEVVTLPAVGSVSTVTGFDSGDGLATRVAETSEEELPGDTVTRPVLSVEGMFSSDPADESEAGLLVGAVLADLEDPR
jgi:hypothetical protein